MIAAPTIGKIVVPSELKACAEVRRLCAVRGGPKTISCPDGTQRTCNAGTQHCQDNNPILCGSPAAPQAACSPGSLAVCIDGSFYQVPPSVVMDIFGQPQAQ